jgi:hypothetical protein
VFVRAELENSEVQVRCIRRRVARRTDVADHLSLRDAISVVQVRRVAFEMRVVVAETLRRIELINRQPTGLAGEQLCDLSVGHRVDGCVSGCQDVDRFVRVSCAGFGESAFQGFESNAVDRNTGFMGFKGFMRFMGFKGFMGFMGFCERSCRLGRAVDAEPAVGCRACGERADERHQRFRCARHRNCTGVPARTSAVTRAASQFVIRTQPCDSVRPIAAGSGVPWRP